MSTPYTGRRSTIGIAFETLPRVLRHSYANLAPLAWMGLLWLLGAVLIVPLAPLTAGLHRVTAKMSEERTVSWRVMLADVRADLAWSWRLTATLLGGMGMLVATLVLAAGSGNGYVHYLAFTVLMLIGVWSGVSSTAFAMALRQHDQQLPHTLRNTLTLVLANAPGIAVSLVVLLLSTVILALVPPLFVLIPGWLALWSTEQTRLLLIKSGYLQRDEVADRVRQG